MTELGVDSNVERPRLFWSTRLTLAFVMFCCVTLMMIFRFNFSIALVCMVSTSSNSSDQHIAEGEFDWDREVVANLLAAYFYGYCCTQVLGGWLAIRLGEKIMIMLGVTGITVGALLLPVLARWNPWAVFGIRVFQGAMSGTVIPTVHGHLNRWTSKEEKGTINAVVFSAFAFGNVINYPISGLLCYSGVDGGWPLIFYVSGALGLTWLLAYHFLCSETPEKHPRISADELAFLNRHSCASQAKTNDHHSNSTSAKKLDIPWGQALMSVSVHALWFTQFAATWVYYVIALNIPLFFDDVFSFGIITNGMLSGIPSALAFAVCLTSGPLIDWLHNRQVASLNTLRKTYTIIGTLGPAILFCLLSEVDGIGAIVLLSLSAMLQQITASGYFISHGDVAGQFGGILYAFCNTMSQLTGFIIPLVIAAMVPEQGDRQGWENFFYLSAGVGGAGALIYLIFGSNSLQDWAKPKTKIVGDG